jgi:uncharacterized protein involved in exopolysaccharide biosynthesis
MLNESPKTSPAEQISIFRLFTRRWRLSIAIVCLCIGLAGLVTLVMPRRYESRMRFLVNNERADLVISPEKNQPTPPTEVTETQVNSEMELLKSRDILETVIRDQELYLGLENKRKAEPSKLDFARAMRKFEKNLNISALRKTNIVEVVFDAPSPDVAVSVLNDLGKRYLSAHLAAHSTPGTYKFFTEQANKYRDRLLQIRYEISNFHRNQKLYSMPEQRSEALQSLQAVENRINDLDAELQAQSARIAEASRQLAVSPERVTTQVRTVPHHLAVQQLQSTLTELRNKRIDLAMKFKSGDRLLTKVDDQIANTARDLANASSTTSEERTTDLNSVRQAIKTDYSQAEINYQSLQGQRTELVRVRSGYLSRLNSMDVDDMHLQRLEQSKREAEDNYDLYVHRLDEARLADSLDREKFSNVALIERPFFSPIPVSPKLSLNLAVGAGIGLCLSLLITFLLESRGNPYANSLEESHQQKLVPSRTFQAASGD